MPLNNAAMVVAANGLRGALAYAQLHSDVAGVTYTDNVTTAGRQALTWGTPTGLGTFSLGAQVNFTGGAASGPVYSVTIWSASTGGTCYGEFVLTGDASFDSSGNYSLTAVDFTGNAA